MYFGVRPFCCDANFVWKAVRGKRFICLFLCITDTFKPSLVLGWKGRSGGGGGWEGAAVLNTLWRHSVVVCTVCCFKALSYHEAFESGGSRSALSVHVSILSCVQTVDFDREFGCIGSGNMCFGSVLWRELEVVWHVCVDVSLLNTFSVEGLVSQKPMPSCRQGCVVWMALETAEGDGVCVVLCCSDTACVLLLAGT